MANAQTDRSVLITGASSGIGRAAALGLAARGFRVFAGVRRELDAESLRAATSGAIEPLMLDVTDRASIAAARQHVERAVGGAGLYGLVNNAGVTASGPLEFVPLDTLRQQFEVNVFGVVAVVQDFAQALRLARGRIVNIGSIGGLIATPFQGPYCASKFALEGLTDSLRRELRPFGIQVSLIEPGSIDTLIWHKGIREAREFYDALPEQARSLYWDGAQRGIEAAQKLAARAVSPEVVTALIVHALEAKRPRTRYRAGIDAVVGNAIRLALPDRALDWVLRRVGYGSR